LICNYVCRLLNAMERKGMRQVTPRSGDETPVAPFVQRFSSGYVQRAVASWPKQGSKAPWRVYQNYLRDILSLKWSPVANKALEFSNPVEQSTKPAIKTVRQQPA
jgi:monooxygenase